MEFRYENDQRFTAALKMHQFVRKCSPKNNKRQQCSSLKLEIHFWRWNPVFEASINRLDEMKGFARRFLQALEVGTYQGDQMSL
jgi:hypothetical protein